MYTVERTNQAVDRLRRDNYSWWNSERSSDIKVVCETEHLQNSEKVQLLKTHTKYRYSSVSYNRNGKIAYTNLRQSLYNLMLLQKNGVIEMAKGSQVATIKSLREENLVYITSRKVGVVADGLLLDNEALVIQTIKLTPLGVEYLNGLSEVAEKIAVKELNRLQKLGLTV